MPKNQRDQIVKTALRLFAQRGFDNTPVSLIAKTAGVSQGLMYNFFKSKEALLEEMMGRGFAHIEESMRSYVEVQDPREAIRTHIEATISIIKKNKEFWKLLHTIRMQGKVLESVGSRFQEVVAQVAKTFEHVFKKLGVENPGLEALLFLSQIDGMVILYLQDEKNVPIDQLGQQIIKRYL